VTINRRRPRAWCTEVSDLRGKFGIEFLLGVS
jgi:hypothetical protein